MKTVLARRKGFQCLHKYVVPEWTDSANSSTFGACFTPHGHGHDYELEVYLAGEVDPTTGMVLNLADVDRVLNEVVAGLDGKHVNLDVPELKGRVPTTERLAWYLFGKLKDRFQGATLVKIRLYEYEDLWLDLWAN
jgi:6-pyruvoyltetrahydropterin/6-carboxytetrahydropterin synthase